MASSVNPPRGMRDFLPAEKARRERVLAVIRSVYSAHGFEEIETPVMEDSHRLHAGLGGDNEKLAFGVLKRGLTAEDLAAAKDPLELADLGLRFDLTVPLARFYATHRAELPRVFRSIQIAPVWRAERPQKGRYRQFVQCDIDIIGAEGPLAEVELIVATVATLDALGLAEGTIRINDRQVLTGLLDSVGFPRAEHEAALVTIDKLDKLGPDGVIAELRERGFAEKAIVALDVHLAGFRGAGIPLDAQQMSAELPAGVDREVIAILAALGDAVGGAGIAKSRLRFDPFLVRGMGYYTGTIFEVEHPDLAYSLGGGGRYDGMIGKFLGTDVPAIGFSLGFERIVDLVELNGGIAADAVALLYDADVAPATLMQLKAALIAGGSRVRLERAPRNVKPLLAQLAASGFSRIATVTADTTGVDDLEFRELVAD